MGVEICAIGGYSETGKNCTAIKIDDEVIVLDMGLHMEHYVQYTQDEDITALTYDELREVDAVPDLSIIDDWKKNVTAIIPSHGHLDHVGAVPFAADFFPDAPIICTPYTAEIIKKTLRDEQLKIPNKIIAIPPNGTFTISDTITLELVHVTHSIVQTAIVAIHTPYGIILYANDYKLDNHPVLGKKTNIKRLTALAEKGVLALIVDSIYAGEHRKMPSEGVAKQMLQDVMLGTNSEGKALIVTTFSSHLARLKSIIEFGKILNRKIVFLGRSLTKYVQAGERLQLINFTKDVELIRGRRRIEQTLHKIEKNRDKYMIVCTGHQGEKNAILSRMARGELTFHFNSGDLVIFSCSVIPVEVNERNREELEHQLKTKGVRMFKDIHVSGHGAREDTRELIEYVRPKYIFPAHCAKKKTIHLADLAVEMGYERDKTVFIMNNGRRVKLLP
jgi:ribonuclease J